MLENLKTSCNFICKDHRNETEKPDPVVISLAFLSNRKFEHYAFERYPQNNSIMPKIKLEK